MYINITCSNCGRHRRISNKKVEYTVRAIKQGWNSFGSALYCPECVRSWHDRNNTELAGEKNTFLIIMFDFCMERTRRENEIKKHN